MYRASPAHDAPGPFPDVSRRQPDGGPTTGRSTRRERTVRAAALAVGALLALGAPVPVGAAAAASAPVAVPPVGWGACDAPDLPPVPATYQCAIYEVPLDHADPSGPTIELALIRRPADDPGARQGSLFVNFGGPGLDAVTTLAQAGDVLFAPAVTAEFDLVGMDPRGVGRSTPLQCVGPTDDYSEYFTPFSWPESARDLRTVRDRNAALDAKCAADGGPIRHHMSTTAVADDLDLLRRAVGDEKLTYVGYSYGSYLGAMYANRYPDKVGALVVDGVLDPVAYATGRDVDGKRVPTTARVNSDVGTQATFEEFLRLCDDAGPEDCAYAGDARTSAAERFDALLQRLQAEPVQDPTTGLGVDHQALLGTVAQKLYNSAGWGLLAQELSRYEQLASDAWDVADLDSTGLPVPAAASLPTLVTGPEQFAAVTCSDSVTPDRVMAWKRAELSRGAGYFGAMWTWADQYCMSWSAEDTDRYLGPWDAVTATPVLIVNARFDAGTDISGALALHDELPGSRMVTVEGWGHTSIGLSVCADAVTTEYLLTREVPDENVVCAQDAAPFPSDVQVQRQQADADASSRAERRDVVLDLVGGSPTGAFTD
ncbi:alpha/beta hydrolase [Actinotalea sp. K2]|uniref:alpha/beta hydrolase n=1 Tax=Actinotalea sp. K2 TaxID=2939438 RepID=UPI0020178D7D|nr:alpha/beta hydrolase [Actinotalea sp. K2]MCL3863297.1 alpha/beta hydrolase [Actinotalea sp. K2]